MSSSNACYNKEVLIDILVRLPPKPLVRFLCASKFLSELISGSIFVTSHFQRNSTRRDNIYLLCHHYPDFTCKDECKDDEDDNQPSEDVEQELQWSFFSNDTFELRTKLSHPFGRTGHFRIYGSSNGVLCISDETLNPKCPIHLWNPTIRKCRTLPLSITDDTKYHYISLQFGFHPKQDDYKVVRMMLLANNAFAVEVYSLSTSSWKLIEDVPVWLKCPSGLCIDVFKDWICLLLSWYCCEEEDMEKCDLWVLQEKKWKQLAPFVFPSDCYRAIGINIDNELKMKRIDLFMGSNLYFCDYESRLVRETCIKLATLMNHDVFASPYMESLVLLNY